MMMENVSPFGAMECERIFSCLDCVKTSHRQFGSIENAAAQTRLRLLRDALPMNGQAMQDYVDVAVEAMLERNFWPEFNTNMGVEEAQMRWERETRKRLHRELREQLVPEIREQLAPEITKTVQAQLEQEATATATTRCNEGLEVLKRQLHTLLTDWESLHNGTQMGAIRAHAKDGSESAKHVVRESSNLLTRAKALESSLSLEWLKETPMTTRNETPNESGEGEAMAPTPVVAAPTPKRQKVAAGTPSIASFFTKQ